MKGVFLTSEARAVCEDVTPYADHIEFMDGYHPRSNRAIYRDPNRKGPAVMLIWHGVPELEDTMDAALAEVDYIKILNQRPRVSKRWLRMFAKYFRVFGQLMLLSFGMGILVFFIYALMVVFFS